jgi:dUTP pyrophosphatase
MYGGAFMKMSVMRDTTIPTRGTSKSAGIDIYVPKFTDNFIRAFDQYNPDPQTQCFIDRQRKLICIFPHGRAYIPTGIRCKVPEGSALVVMNKGGTSWKDRVTKVAELVDEDYQGEIFITLVNYSEYKTTLMESQKLVQLVRVPVFYDIVEMVKDEEIFSEVSERGAGAMGSTGV